MSNKLVVCDADAIIAQANAEDSNHTQAVKIAQNLVAAQITILYPATTIVEAVTHIQRAFSKPVTAYDTARLMIDPAIHIVEIDKQTLIAAMKYFSPTASKKNTFFDCIVAAVAQEYSADAIFSFDAFYRHKGFTLAGDLDW